MTDEELDALAARFDKAARSMNLDFLANRHCMLAARERGDHAGVLLYEIAIRSAARNLDRWEKMMAEFEEEKAARRICEAHERHAKMLADDVPKDAPERVALEAELHALLGTQPRELTVEQKAAAKAAVDAFFDEE